MRGKDILKEKESTYLNTKSKVRLQLTLVTDNLTRVTSIM